MKFSSPENEYLVSLLCAAIKCDSAPKAPQQLNWEKLVSLAKKQQVYSTILPLIKNTDMPAEAMQEIIFYSQNELIRTIAMKNEFELIEKELEANKIKFMPLKGEIIKNYYPKSQMRQMSDIDILYDEEKRAELFSFMKERGYSVYTGDNSDDFSKKPFYSFEFHRDLFFKESGFYCDFSHVWDNAKKCDGYDCKYSMNINDTYIYTVAHMYKHYLAGGFGIRFLADLYLLIMHDGDKYDEEYISRKSDEYSVSEFEQFVKKLSIDMFSSDSLTDEQTVFLDKMLDSGVYGKGESIIMYYNEYINKIGGKGTPLGFYASKIFPSKKYMKNNYIILEKKPYLLPCYYVYRLFYKMTHMRKAIYKNYKLLKDYYEKDN